MLFCFGIVDETVNRAAITFWLSHFEMLVQVFSSFEKSNRWVKTLLPFVRCMTFNINCSILFKPHLRMICSKGVYIYSKHFAKWSFYIWISSQIKNVRPEFINPLHCIMYMQTYESCSHEWWQTGNKRAEWKDILNPLSYAHLEKDRFHVCGKECVNGWEGCGDPCIIAIREGILQLYLLSHPPCTDKAFSITPPSSSSFLPGRRTTQT